ncbi:universal stress protein [Sphingobacterium multivorum]
MLKDWQIRIDDEFPDLRCKTVSLAGNLEKTVLNLLQEKEYHFIVMGAKGKGMIQKAVLGSNTFALIKKSPIGVLAVPITFQKFGLQNIALLSNF